MTPRIYSFIESPLKPQQLERWILTNSSTGIAYISSAHLAVTKAIDQLHIIGLSGSKARRLPDLVKTLVLRSYEAVGQKPIYGFKTLGQLDLFLDNGGTQGYLKEPRYPTIYLYEFAEKILLDEPTKSLDDFIEFVNCVSERLCPTGDIISQHSFKFLLAGDLDLIKSRLKRTELVEL
jgi:hypothetical protein